MAQGFLNQLERIPEGQLSTESFCMICHIEYGGDSGEVPVRLPCNHHVGLHCIRTWLSHDSRNSCPMCRRVFFEVIDEEEEQQSYREIVRRVGLPPHERDASEDYTSHTWYDYFVEAAAEQYQQSLILAEAYLRQAYPRYRQYHIDSLATAIRTLPIREVLLYWRFASDGALPPLVGLSRPLNAQQLEAIFQELRRRGAFDIELHPFPTYHGLTDRQMFLLHREEGESYSPWEGGYWSV